MGLGPTTVTEQWDFWNNNWRSNQNKKLYGLLIGRKSYEDKKNIIKNKGRPSFCYQMSLR